MMNLRQLAPEGKTAFVDPHVTQILFDGANMIRWKGLEQARKMIAQGAHA